MTVTHVISKDHNVIHVRVNIEFLILRKINVYVMSFTMKMSRKSVHYVIKNKYAKYVRVGQYAWSVILLRIGLHSP